MAMNAQYIFSNVKHYQHTILSSSGHVQSKRESFVWSWYMGGMEEVAKDTLALLEKMHLKSK